MEQRKQEGHSYALVRSWHQLARHYVLWLILASKAGSAAGYIVKEGSMPT